MVSIAPSMSASVMRVTRIGMLVDEAEEKHYIYG
jgi:hypothetical protein